MSEMTEEERSRLVELLRVLSPKELGAEQPDLRPDLGRLVGARLPRRPRAILFDVYGTLVISAAGGEPNLRGSHDAAECVEAQATLEKELHKAGYNGGTLAFEEAVTRLIRTTREEAIQRTPHPEIDIEDLVSRLVPEASPAMVRLLALLLEAMRNPCAPMPGARALLGRLHGGRIRLGLVSNAQFYTPLLIEALLGGNPATLGLEPELTAYSFELGVAKPDPAPFLKAATPLLESGTRPQDVVVIGNSSNNDIAPARALGFMTALFAGDTRSFRPSCPLSPGALPDVVLQGFADLDFKLRTKETS
ncbi:MAG: HAD family hydrolase [Spirochaetaceae bacterium]|nr:HAD family hydrolase [Spirochaetaceae bacterium]